jgi:hypothetical protein
LLDDQELEGRRRVEGDRVRIDLEGGGGRSEEGEEGEAE